MTRLARLAVALVGAVVAPVAAQAPNQEPEIATTVAFTEGPTSDRAGNVYFTDIINQRIMKLGTDGKLSIYREKSNVANGLLIDSQGRLIACEGALFERPGVKVQGTPRVTRTDLKTGKVEDARRRNTRGSRSRSQRRRPSTAREACTSPTSRASPCIASTLSRRGLAPVRLLAAPDVQRPNGIQVSPDDKTLYLIEANQAPRAARA